MSAVHVIVAAGQPYLRAADVVDFLTGSAQTQPDEIAQVLEHLATAFAFVAVVGAEHWSPQMSGTADA